MTNVAELTYFDIRGRAEIIRIALCKAEIEFLEKDVDTLEEFKRVSREALFGQLPRLKIDGLDLVQTNAIVRYVANKGNLSGTSPWESARIDVLYEGTRDFNNAYFGMRMMQKEESQLQKAKDVTLPKYLPIFEKVLQENKTGFLVGGTMTLADIGLLEPILYTTDYFGEQVFTSYPGIQKYLSMMKKDEKIAHYISRVRKPPNTDESVASLMKTMGFK